jgi:hypothetical protein
MLSKLKQKKMIEVINLIKNKRAAELNSPLIHQRVLRNIHKVSKDEIARTVVTLSLITEHLKAKKQEKQRADIVPVYLVF